jgi:hypothetical protein
MQITLNDIQAGVVQGCLFDTAVAVRRDSGNLTTEQAQALEIECMTIHKLIEEAKGG